MILETPEERVKLLRAGITGRTIEYLFNLYNNIKIVGGSTNLFELVEVDAPKSYKI